MIHFGDSTIEWNILKILAQKEGLFAVYRIYFYLWRDFLCSIAQKIKYKHTRSGFCDHRKSVC